MAKMCSNCGKKISAFSVSPDIEGLPVCKDCQDIVRQQLDRRKRILEEGKAEEVVVTSTNSIDGHKINQYLGIVSGKAVMGVSFIQDFFAEFRDIWGGRSKGLQREFSKGEDLAIREAKVECALKGGNALVGMRIDYENIEGKGKQMIVVIATGTAVKISEKK